MALKESKIRIAIGTLSKRMALPIASSTTTEIAITATKVRVTTEVTINLSVSSLCCLLCTNLGGRLTIALKEVAMIAQGPIGNTIPRSTDARHIGVLITQAVKGKEPEIIFGCCA
jgi:hypothetical protein